MPVTRDVLVLCYHGVSAEWPCSLAVTPEAFERQLALLVERGYRGATFTEAVLDPPARKTVAVTFDDGYRSVIEQAAPLLERLGLPGTVFVPTAYVGDAQPMSWPGIDEWATSSHASELMPLSWGQLDELAAAGWEIGSHTHTHPRLTTLDEDRLAAELSRSRSECETNLGRRCTSIAYPFGDTDARVARAAERAGYAAAAALPSPLLTRPMRYRWPRIGIYRGYDLGDFRRAVSPVLRRMRRSPAWRVVQARHRLLSG